MGFTNSDGVRILDLNAKICLHLAFSMPSANDLIKLINVREIMAWVLEWNHQTSNIYIYILYHLGRVYGGVKVGVAQSEAMWLAEAAVVTVLIL